MLNKKFTSIACVLMLTTVVTACGSKSDDLKSRSKDELIEMFKKSQQTIVGLNDEIDALNEKMSILTDGNSNALIDVGDGTEKYSFHSTDSQIIFDEAFSYPISTTIAATGTLYINKDVNVTPGNNWTIRMEGPSVELEHSSGISGKIVVSGITTPYVIDFFQQDVIEPWFKDNNIENVSYTPIYVSNTLSGYQGEASIYIDGEPAYLKCGMAGFNKYAVTYVFVYRGAQDMNKDESVDSVVNSIGFTSKDMIITQN